MSYFKPAIYEQFFAPLVGTAEREAAFAARLRPPEGTPAAMYNQLRLKLEDELLEATLPLRLSDVDRTYLANNSYTAPLLAVASLRSIGDLHAAHARRTKGLAADESVVRRNVHVGMGRVYGIANSDSRAAAVTISADTLGVTPDSERRIRHLSSVFALAAKAYLFGPKTVRRFSPRAFTREIDDNGQLHIRPRYAKATVPAGRHCPAVEARLERTESSHRPSAMYTMLQAVGEIAIQDIYPKQFPITR